MGKIEIRPARRQFVACGTDIADERSALAYQAFDGHRDAEGRVDDLRGLQGTRVGAGNDPPNGRAAQSFGHGAGLFVAEISQLRVFYAGVDSGLGVGDVEKGLGVPQQNHGFADIQRGWSSLFFRSGAII